MLGHPNIVLDFSYECITLKCSSYEGTVLRYYSHDGTVRKYFGYEGNGTIQTTASKKPIQIQICGNTYRLMKFRENCQY